jgi:hypothetical protein
MRSVMMGLKEWLEWNGVTTFTARVYLYPSSIALHACMYVCMSVHVHKHSCCLVELHM